MFKSLRVFITLLSAVALLALAGCAGGKVNISPAIVQQGVATSVAYSVTKYPQALPYLRAAAPVICSAANSTNLSPAQVIAALESSNAALLKTPEAALIMNTALLLYIGVYESYGDNALNNYPALRPYLQATCDGMNDGVSGKKIQPATPTVSDTWPQIAFP